MLARSRAERAVLLASCGATTFGGAVLSFALQPLVGRHLLPLLGGAPAVWVSCLAFFQLALVVGYLLVHLASRWLSLRVQVVTQAALLLAVLLRGPLTLAGVSAAATLTPVATVGAFMLANVALAYVALATTAPLLQCWYALATAREPYGLYALSNLGSLLGLLAYPLVIEPLLGLNMQARVFCWSFEGYAACALLSGVLVLRAQPSQRVAAARPARPPVDIRASTRRAVSWLLLSAAPSALLLATSHHITVDVAPAPLVWVLPLALYLATFVLAFARLRRASSQAWPALLIAGTIAMPILLMPGNQVHLALLLFVPLATLFAGAMVCHGKLAELRPDPSQLTTYYLMIAAGGALGGGFVAFVAPLVFADHYELVLSLLAVHALQLGLPQRRARGLPSTGLQRLAWLGGGLAVPVLLATLWVQAQGLGRAGHMVARSRSFFGSLQVRDTTRTRVLIHGRTDQGQALRAAGRSGEPIAFAGPSSGAGRAFTLHGSGRPRALGVIGLGIGMLAAYATSQDTLRFYEIDPDVILLARRHFDFLRRSRAPLTIATGDGRLTLAREHNHFDVLALDVFSSDAVPPHLLTVEAFALYAAQLAPDGVLLANVSNRHLSLERVVAGSARANGLACVVLESPGDEAAGLLRARWAVMARDREQLRPLLGAPARELGVPDPVTWTDQRSSLWSIAF